MSDHATPKTIFQKIMEGEIPAKFIHEDELCVGIEDIQPRAPIHYLLIPRKAIRSVMELEESDRELMSHLIFTAKKIASEKKLSAYRLQINNGEQAGQTVFHLHMHLMGWN